MQPTFMQLKSKAKESLKGKWSVAIAASMTLVALSLLDIILQYILMSVFRVDAVWSVVEPTTVPHYSRIAGYGITVFSSLYSLFLFVPFAMGVLRWFWKNSHGEEVSLSEVFYYFSSGKRFFKTVYLAFLLFLCVCLGAVVCFLPYVMMVLLAKPQFYALFGAGMPLWVSSLFPLTQFFEVAGMFLFICWVARYMLFFVPFFADSEQSAVKIIAESVRLTKGKLIRLVGFIFSFLGWLILCVFVLPMVFVIPFALASVIEYGKEEQRFDRQKSSFGTWL